MSSLATSDSGYDLSIVIVSWNTRDLLDRCLASVFADLRRSPGFTAEVWVVDNASSDGSPALVRERYPEARLRENRENIGFARANNQALAEASGRCFLLLNSDTVVGEGTLRQVVAAMEARPRAAVAGPLLLNADGSVQHSWARFPGLASEFSGRLNRAQSPYPLAAFEEARQRAEMEPFVVDWVGGACFFVRAAAAAQVGLLDDRFFMYCEETEWCHRFRRAGWETLLVPTCVVTHLGGQSSKAVPTATRRRMYLSSVRLYRILYGRLRALGPVWVATARFALSHCKRRAARSA